MQLGHHFWNGQGKLSSKSRVLQDPAWPGHQKARVSYEKIIQPAYRQGRQIGQLKTRFSEGMAAIRDMLHDKTQKVSNFHASGYHENRDFKTSQYRLKVREVNQAAWDYGCMSDHCRLVDLQANALQTSQSR